MTPVAEWNFADSLTSGAWTLADGDGSHARVTASGIRFDGVNDFLRIDRDRVGALDIARRGEEVTVVALARRDSLDTGFIAGLWQEHDHDPRRQYGLFLSLPTYGGGQQVVGHVSADGAASDDLPYSRDYSASARMVAPGQWRVVGFTYDGEHITSYLDGVADARPQFTERGAPLGAARSYAKNPYYYPHGLNAETTSEFTVGAVMLTGGMGNFFKGDLARLAVWDSALTAGEMMAVARAWTAQEHPLVRFDFYRPPGGVDRVSGGWDGDRWPLAAVGWTGDATVSVEAGRLVGSGRARFDGIAGLDAERVRITWEGEAELTPVIAHGHLTGLEFVLPPEGSLSTVQLWNQPT